MQALPFDSPLTAYEDRARALLEGHRAKDGAALELIRKFDPRFRNPEVPWLPEDVSPERLAAAPFELEDARATVANGHSFADWPALREWVAAVAARGPVYAFESAVEAVVDGDLPALGEGLRRDPSLVRARSTRRTCFDPPVHRATLLHYVAANGVEAHRQRTPPNAVDIARTLLEAGADVDALASLYGGECTTMSLLVSSSHPAEAGVQTQLVETLLDFGAEIEGRGEKWGTPLMTALAFGFPAVAEVLARRGARVDSLAAAAGLGRASEAERLLPAADAAQRHLALALAAQLGRAGVVRLLLDVGEDPNRHNPRGAHGHATPLHQAVWARHADVVRLLVERGAHLDLRDKVYGGTPLDWARHAGSDDLAAYLLGHGAK